MAESKASSLRGVYKAKALYRRWIGLWDMSSNHKSIINTQPVLSGIDNELFKLQI